MKGRHGDLDISDALLIFISVYLLIHRIHRIWFKTEYKFYLKPSLPSMTVFVQVFDFL